LAGDLRAPAAFRDGDLFLAVDFRAVDFRAVDFRAVDFRGVVFLLAGERLPVDFLAPERFAVDLPLAADAVLRAPARAVRAVDFAPRRAAPAVFLARVPARFAVVLARVVDFRAVDFARVVAFFAVLFARVAVLRPRDARRFTACAASSRVCSTRSVTVPAASRAASAAASTAPTAANPALRSGVSISTSLPSGVSSLKPYPHARQLSNASAKKQTGPSSGPACRMVALFGRATATRSR
jgi:hypothetical protein